MEPLPHALFETSDTALSLPEGCGVLVRAGTAGDSRVKGSIVLVVATVDVKTLRGAIGGGAAGIALTGWRTGADIQRLSALLSVAEAEERRTNGATPIFAITDGVLPAPVSHEGLSEKSGRLAALVWDQSILRRTLGATRVLTQSGAWTAPFAAARAATLLTAAAAGIAAYDSFPDLTGAALETAGEQSRSDGFFGGLAGHVTQIAMLRTVYGRGGAENAGF